MTFLGAVLRFLAGFVLACLAAGLVQVLFAVTPRELVVAGDERWGEAMQWALLSATQIAVFAAPFALIAWLISEWQGIRSFAFHAIVAMAVAVAGFGLIHATESPTEASIVNSYAMAAYLTSGFVGGLVYWLFAGRFATRRSNARVRMESEQKNIARDVAAAGKSGRAAVTESRGEASRKVAEVASDRSVTRSGGTAVPATRSPRGGQGGQGKASSSDQATGPRNGTDAVKPDDRSSVPPIVPTPTGPKTGGGSSA